MMEAKLPTVVPEQGKGQEGEKEGGAVDGHPPPHDEFTFVNISEDGDDQQQQYSSTNLSGSGTGNDVMAGTLLSTSSQNEDTLRSLASDSSKMDGSAQVKKASAYLNSKGFGWLLELDDDDDEGVDEQKPLLEELDIDLGDIFYKLRCVLLPLPWLKLNRTVLKERPDFWGPLMVVLFYALVSLYGQLGVVSWIITIWFFGSILLFVLGRVMGGESSFSQTLGVLGYSLLPLIIVGLLLPLVSGVAIITDLVKWLGVCWATYSAGSLLVTDGLEEKKLLLLYPIFLLYIYLFSLNSGA